MLEHFPFLSFPRLVLSPDYPKPPVVTYEETMPFSTFSLWFPIFQPPTLNPEVFRVVTSIVLCYP